MGLINFITSLTSKKSQPDENIEPIQTKKPEFTSLELQANLDDIPPTDRSPTPFDNVGHQPDPLIELRSEVLLEPQKVPKVKTPWDSIITPRSDQYKPTFRRR